MVHHDLDVRLVELADATGEGPLLASVVRGDVDGDATSGVSTPVPRKGQGTVDAGRGHLEDVGVLVGEFGNRVEDLGDPVGQVGEDVEIAAAVAVDDDRQFVLAVASVDDDVFEVETLLYDKLFDEFTHLRRADRHATPLVFSCRAVQGLARSCSDTS